MRTRKSLREAGRNDLSGKWGKAVLVTLVYCLIVLAVYAIAQLFNKSVNAQTDTTSLFQMVLNIFIQPIAWVFVIMFLRNHRGDESAFDLNNFLDALSGRVFTTLCLQYVYTFLWTLLLIIPGIIKSLSYAMTPFILYDDPDIKNNEAIELSMKMMKGHKMELFLLGLSFIGWFLLCILTLGIGFLWLSPYVQSTFANYYEDRKADFAAGI